MRSPSPPRSARVLIEIGSAGAIVGVDSVSGCFDELHAAVLLHDSTAALQTALELEPTLVLGMQGDGAADVRERLHERGIRVYEVRARTLDGVLRTYREIGRLVGRPSEAQARVTRTTQEIAKLSASTTGLARPRVAWILSHDPLTVPGGASLLHDLLEIAGGENPFELPRVAQREITLEELADAAPDLILDATRTAPDPLSRRTAREEWSRFPWVKRLERIAPATTKLPALDIASRIRELHALLHPRARRRAIPRKRVRSCRVGSPRRSRA